MAARLVLSGPRFLDRLAVQALQMTRLHVSCHTLVECVRIVPVAARADLLLVGVQLERDALLIVVPFGLTGYYGLAGDVPGRVVVGVDFFRLPAVESPERDTPTAGNFYSPTLPLRIDEIAFGSGTSRAPSFSAQI